MDFSKLIQDGQAKAPIEPRELYQLLPDKRPGYGYLRDVQAQILTEWHLRRSESDLLIKVNTGGGKTIDGLIILQSYLNEGISPALYVAPDKFLVSQVLDDAKNIGIRTVVSPDDPAYLAGEAIAVVNAHKLFNGRTVFSEARESSAPVSIGAVIIDDAHAAEATVKESLSLRIAKENGAYGKLLELFAEDIQQQSQEWYLDLEEGARGALAQVPFWAWRAKLERARLILRAEAKSAKNPLFYSWPAVAELLPFCRVVFDALQVTVTPFVPPVHHVSAFKNAKRRIYLSATVPNEGALIASFGAEPESIRKPILPLAAGDIGERMILAPQAISPHIPDEAIRAQITELSAKFNTVVLVPSKAAMQKWPDAVAYAAAESSENFQKIDDVVSELKSGSHVGLVVLANKYDGIDLPQNACRLLVIDGLPESFSGEERIESRLTAQETGVDIRQVQRIEQGMGRGVRSNEDYCVIILLGSRVSQLTLDPRTLSLFSAATRAQLESSKQVSQNLSNRSLTEIFSVAQQALDRDAGWVNFAKQGLRDVQHSTPAIAEGSVERRKAFESAVFGDLPSAVEVLRAAAKPRENTKLTGWLLERAASYADQINPDEAQHLLVEARRTNSHTTLPLAGVAFKKLIYKGDQAARYVEVFRNRFSGKAAMRLGFEAVLDDLVFDPERTEAFEEAIYQLGKLLGLESERPEQKLGKGPDDLWCVGANTYWIIEAKTGATSSKIAKRDAGQLGQSAEWFKRQYGTAATAIPVMVHLQTDLWKDASKIPGMKVLTSPGLDRLKSAVQSFSTGLASLDLDDAGGIFKQLEAHKLTESHLSEYLRDARQG